MITLDQALDRLLTCRSYREAFVEGRHEALGLSVEHLAALRSVDPVQLALTADRVRDSVFARRFRGSGSLRSLYSQTIDAWLRERPKDLDLRELASQFTESASYRRYREFGFAGVGTCLEEAFFEFCESADVGDAARREREFHAAVIRALAVSPRPSFSIPACVRTVRSGYVAIARRDSPFLNATVDGRVLTGPLSPFLADLMASEGQRERVARHYGVDGDALDAAVARLAAMGVLS